MTKIAYIILAHKNPSQLVRLIQRLHSEQTVFLVHIDLKSHKDVYNHTVNALSHLDNILFLRRHKIFWGDFSQVHITIEALKQLFEKAIDFDYVKLLSGQDYPIKSNESILRILTENQNHSFLENFSLPDPWWFKNGEPNGGLDRINYFHFRIANRLVRTPIRRRMPCDFKVFAGSAYWLLSREHALYMYNFVRLNSHIINFFKGTGNPDEVFFQTIIMNSPFDNKIINDNLTYTTWSANASHPKILEKTDLNNLYQSSCLFARKFDYQQDDEILDLIDQKFLN